MFHLLSVFIFFLFIDNSNSSNTFIALLDPLSKPSPFLSQKLWYSSIISSLPASSSSSSIIHVYSAPIHGFSATLTPDQVKSIRKLPGVLSLFPDKVLHLHTTRSPSFLGLETPNPWMLNTSESNSIIGFIDTGIWPEHPSFSDHNLGPIPVHWKGQCESGFKFNHTNCNLKMIGARFFSGGYDAWFGQSGKPVKEFRSPRDSDGHGTHVASIAAGSPVPGSGFFGFAVGLARGMAPRARIAVYKVCWASGCLLSDVCKAFESAITDGVDIISLSLGSSCLPFYLDLLSILSFRAFSHGIFIAASAGNEGPTLATVANVPPWITTVGAGTVDRDFPATIHLKNKVSVLEGHVARLSLGAVLKRARAIAMILSHGNIDPNGIVSEPHVIQTISIGALEGKVIEDYILYDENPMAKISSQGTISMHAKPAPIVASFSSRGPNSLVPGILKPDILAPGVNILGAWTDAIGPSGKALDFRRSRFNIMSGTSMACPHVSGAAALIKSTHPDWGPNEIKSALMTTSTIHKHYNYNRNKPFSPISDESTGNAATPFDIGSGHMLPIKAMDPGLVFGLEHQDYVNFLCELNYTKKQLQIVTGKKSHCSNDSTWQLNYPTVTVEAEKVWHGAVVVARKMTNANKGSSEYKAKVVGPKGYYKVDVKPKRLKFSGISDQSLSFRIVLEKESNMHEMKNLWFGALIWSEKRGKHKVKCPIMIFSAKEYSGG
ncbi:Peptidase S8/S53 domain - like 10 [Theobroma cacao]|nr:Peptidase S8/S53 domain - like 10 [Theobroma cacao]